MSDLTIRVSTWNGLPETYARGIMGLAAYDVEHPVQLGAAPPILLDTKTPRRDHYQTSDTRYTRIPICRYGSAFANASKWDTGYTMPTTEGGSPDLRQLHDDMMAFLRANGLNEDPPVDTSEGADPVQQQWLDAQGASRDDIQGGPAVPEDWDKVEGGGALGPKEAKS